MLGTCHSVNPPEISPTSPGAGFHLPGAHKGSGSSSQPAPGSPGGFLLLEMEFVLGREMILLPVEQKSLRLLPPLILLCPKNKSS